MQEIIKQGKLTFICEEESGLCRVSACEKDATEIEIPFEVNGMNVISICAHAFEDCTELVSLKLPDLPEELYFERDGLELIGSYAFSGCSKLKEIEIPDTVGTIERGAFYGCDELERVTILRRCYIGDYAFARCRSLKEISPLPYVSEGMFSQCESLSEIAFLPKVKMIEEDAFEHTALEQVVIPKTIKNIGKLAFRSCYNLKTVTFEDPEGWWWKCRYNDEEYPLDLSSPEKNAKTLSRMDFDDGVSYWYKK